MFIRFNVYLVLISKQTSGRFEETKYNNKVPLEDCSTSSLVLILGCTVQQQGDSIPIVLYLCYAVH